MATSLAVLMRASPKQRKLLLCLATANEPTSRDDLFFLHRVRFGLATFYALHWKGFAEPCGSIQRGARDQLWALTAKGRKEISS